MGRPKLLLPWNDTSVIGHLIRQWQDLGAEQVAVVCAAGDPAIQAELDRLGFAPDPRIINAAPERGMFSSVRSAAQWSGWQTGLTHWAIVLGDQPHLSGKTLRRIIQFSAAHPAQICVPRQDSHRRHPVLLPKPAFLQVATSSATDLRQFLDHPPVKVEYCETNAPALGLDIDRPEEYEKAMRMFLRNELKQQE